MAFTSPLDSMNSDSSPVDLWPAAPRTEAKQPHINRYIGRDWKNFSPQKVYFFPILPEPGVGHVFIGRIWKIFSAKMNLRAKDAEMVRLN
jgi:hypothetical protein